MPKRMIRAVLHTTAKKQAKGAAHFLMKQATLCSRDTLHYLTLFSKVKLLIGVKKSALIFNTL